MLTLLRTRLLHLAVGLVLFCSLLSGCFSPWVSGDDPTSRREQIKDTLQSEKRPRIVGQIAFERMITLSRLENVALVTSLPGTGGKVKPSQPREKLLEMMRRHDGDQPNTVLDAPTSTMVVAHIDAPPAARRGDIMDVQIQLSAHSEATSLQQGWMLETPLVEMSRVGGQLREGFEMATAHGPIVTAAEINGSDDPQDQIRGVIVGGAKLRKSRDLGIGLEPEFADAVTMGYILQPINARFTAFNGRKQAGIATPLEDSHIKLDVPPRYQLDPFHFVNVVLQIGFNESEAQQLARIETLQKQLLEPTTVKKACWQLEAIGEKSAPMLAEVLSHPNSEIRFYAAHSLAYLNDKRAVAPLTELAEQYPAFRAMSLNGLTILDHYEASDALSGLLNSSDPETRYGAVRALRRKDASDAQVSGRKVGEIGRILEIPTSGPPMVVVSLTQTPEVVIFGDNPILALPTFEYVTPKLMIKSQSGGKLTIIHFKAGEDDRQVQVNSDLRSLLEGIAEVGGTYGNWVSFVRQASHQGYLTVPLAMNPVPQAGRTFDRSQEPVFEPGEHFYENTIGATPPRPAVWYNPMTWMN